VKQVECPPTIAFKEGVRICNTSIDMGMGGEVDYDIDALQYPLSEVLVGNVSLYKPVTLVSRHFPNVSPITSYSLIIDVSNSNIVSRLEDALDKVAPNESQPASHDNVIQDVIL